MSTRSFSPLVFEEIRAIAPIAAVAEPDTVTRPVAIRASPLVFPELPTTLSSEAMEHARVQGHAAGYAAGRRAATATLEADRAAQRDQYERELLQLHTAIEAVARAAGRLNAQTVGVLEDAEEAVLSAAVEIATAVLGHEPLDTRDSALAAVRRALEAAGPSPVHTVRLHPADFALVQEATLGEPGVRFAPDPVVRRGDALADVPHGVIDAGIRSALERVRSTLLGEAD